MSDLKELHIVGGEMNQKSAGSVQSSINDDEGIGKSTSVTSVEDLEEEVLEGLFDEVNDHEAIINDVFNDNDGDVDDFIKDAMKEIDPEELEEEDVDAFSLSDISEIPSALEILNERSNIATPYPTAPKTAMSSISSLDSYDDFKDFNDSKNRPWLVSSSFARRTFPIKPSNPDDFARNQQQQNNEDAESWIRVDISENSTVRLSRGFNDEPAAQNNPEVLDQADDPHIEHQRPKLAFLSIVDLMNRFQDEDSRRTLVGAIHDRDTGYIYRLEIDRAESGLPGSNPGDQAKLEVDFHAQMSWCSKYLLLRVFGLLLVIISLLLMVNSSGSSHQTTSNSQIILNIGEDHHSTPNISDTTSLSPPPPLTSNSSSTTQESQAPRAGTTTSSTTSTTTTTKTTAPLTLTSSSTTLTTTTQESQTATTATSSSTTLTTTSTTTNTT